MFVTTATSGSKTMNEPSLSSVSATKTSPLPWWALAPLVTRLPPTAKDGSSPQCCSATVSMDVVVVLPCVPATATLRYPRIRATSATVRGSTRKPRARASTSSGFDSGTAEDTTTVSASPR